MEDNVLLKASNALVKQKRRKRWHRVVSFMEAVVVFVTTYALILPAITMEQPKEYKLTAVTPEGVTVILTGPAQSFSAPLNELSLSVTELTGTAQDTPGTSTEEKQVPDESASTASNAPDGSGDETQVPDESASNTSEISNVPGDGKQAQDESASKTSDAPKKPDHAALAIETLDTALRKLDADPLEKRLFDICLWHGDEEIEPIGPVVLTFKGLGNSETAGEAKVYHIDEEGQIAKNMPAKRNSDGSIAVETDHFSIYGVALLAEITPMASAAGSVWDNRANGMTLNLFDYLSYQGPSAISDPDSTTLRTLINTTNGQSGGTWRNLRFVPQGSTSLATQNYYTGSAEARQGIVALTLDSSGYPVLTSQAGGDSLRYLFDPTASDNAGSTRVRYTYADVNKLFKIDADGYVVYDSDVDYAYYNTSTSANPNKEFTLRETYQVSENGVGFFPFDTYNTSNTNRGPTASGTPFNHHFGLTLQKKFKMPKDGKVNGQNMVFSFSGDDDMWVFIDDRLVLDIGGIHGKASGYIDFATGQVVVSNGTVAMSGATVRGATTTLNTIFGANYFKYDGTTEYTIRCFYLERGGYDSNLMLRMNFPMGQNIDIPVSKIWDDNNNSTGNRPSSVTVRLFADGVATDKTLTLNAAGSWKGSFEGVPLYAADNLTEIQYTIQEDPIQYYQTSYSLANTDIWVPVTSLAAGETYMLVYNNNTQAVSHNGATSPALAAASVNTPVSVPLTVGSTEYESWMLRPPTATQWQASASGSRFFLRSVATPQRYISYTGSGNFSLAQSTDGSGGSAFSYDSNKRLSVSRSGTHYMQNAGTRTTSASSATSYTLYRQVKGSETLQTNGLIVVNTYVSTTGTLTLAKTNQDIPAISLSGVRFELYPAMEQPAGTWVKANETPYAAGSTGSDGRLTFSGLTPGTYLLYETIASQGYQLPASPWRVTVQANGNLTVADLTANGGVYTITNKKESALLIAQKQWRNPDGTEKTSGLPDEIGIQLWRRWTTIGNGGAGESHTVNFYAKVLDDSPAGTSNVLVDTKEVAAGGFIEFYGHIWVEPSSVTANGTVLISTGTYFNAALWKDMPVYTLSDITADQDVIFNFDQVQFWDNSISSFVYSIKDYTLPGSGGSGGADETTQEEFVEYAVLDATNNWQWVWDTLPADDGNGNTYYYYVKEIDSPPGFKVSYDNNDGVIGGVITIINQTVFILPETGGIGTIPYTMAGILLMVGAGLMYKKKLFRKGGRDSP